MEHGAKISVRSKSSGTERPPARFSKGINRALEREFRQAFKTADEAIEFLNAEIRKRGAPKRKPV
jgi:hypothetical protein